MKKLCTLLSSCLCFFFATTSAQVTTQTLSYTGAAQTFTVPTCVSSISFTCYGAQGASGASTASGAIGGTGGLGAMISGIYTLTPGTIVNVFVGGAGSGSLAGYNGGGSGSNGNSGAGGGATDIRIGGIALNNRVLVAGGGGGGGNAGCASSTITGGSGGAGGGGNGGNGVNSVAGGGGQGGQGTVGGATGIGCSFATGTAGTTGTFGIAGNGGNGPSICGAYVSGGGGGGGYYGGGGGGGGTAGTTSCTLNDQGGGGGGAGGTNYFGAAASGTAVTNGVRTGNGLVIVSYSLDPTPVISVNSGSICTGSSFVIVPSGASTYTFSGGSATVSPTSSASYTVTGTSSLGCVGNAAVSSVTVNPNPVITVNSGSICSGGSFTINPSGASTYTVSGGSFTVSPITNASYTVNGTNSFGCTNSSPAISTVSVQASPTISVNSGSICAGQIFTIVPTGASTYTYSSGSATLSPVASTVVNVSGTSTNGCVSTASAVANITVVSLPIVAVNSGSICAGQVFTLTPSGALTYTFLTGSNTVAPVSSASYSVIGSNSVGCISLPAVSNVTVYSLPILTVIATPTTMMICNLDPITFTASGASTYTWNGISTGLSFSATPSASGIYTLIGTDANGCANVATVPFTVNPLPVVTVVSTNTFLCLGQNATLTASGGLTYLWSVPTVTTATVAVSPSVTSNYSVTAISAFGCTKTETIAIQVNTLVVTASSNTVLCNGSSVTLSLSAANSYTWMPGNMSTGSINITPSVTTTYTYDAADAAQCHHLGFVTVSVNPTPTVTINSNTLICNGESVTLTAMGASSYSWTSPSGTTGAVIVLTPSSTASYSVVGTDVNGCTAIGVSEVSVNLCTGITAIRSELVGISIYPNPANTVLNIELNNNLSKTVTLTDLSGRTVRVVNSNDDRVELNIVDLANGVYYATISSGSEQRTIKVIKQ